jgi:hypothetical protein
MGRKRKKYRVLDKRNKKVFFFLVEMLVYHNEGGTTATVALLRRINKQPHGRSGKGGN